MEKDCDGAVVRACLRITDVQDAGFDLFEWTERCIGTGSHLGRRRIRLGARQIDHAEAEGDGSCCDTQELSPMLIDILSHLGSSMLSVGFVPAEGIGRIVDHFIRTDRP
jgi:hypothetical protein